MPCNLNPPAVQHVCIGTLMNEIVHESEARLTSYPTRIVQTYQACLLIEAVRSIAQCLGLHEHAPDGIGAGHLVVEETHDEYRVLQTAYRLAFYST